MLKQPVDITAFASLSALGHEDDMIHEQLVTSQHCLRYEQGFWAGRLPIGLEEELLRIQKEKKAYRKVDKTVLMGIMSARLLQQRFPLDTSLNTGINMGSSRGATRLWERHHGDFMLQKSLSPSASPSTTLGNISSWIADDLRLQGPVLSHSITCSTALHGLLNGVAWLQSGMADVFLVGGSEAPLTPFTMAQMNALKLTSPAIAQQSEQYPCRSMDLSKTENHLVLGEGAGMFRLEIATRNPLARIVGIGYATEPLESAAGLSAEAHCFQHSMKQALGGLPPEEVDAIVMHAPGTLKGDNAEYKAIQKVFCNKTPYLTTHKWKIGHTFGASGVFSILQALFMLENDSPLPLPFSVEQSEKHINPLDYVLVNAVGFGGNAVSILLSK